MFLKLKTGAVVGIDCLPIEVEIDINKGQTNFTVVGLPDAAIKEATDRIYSAIKNSGFNYPFNFRILVNLAPADTPKQGSSYDLAMAIGIITINNKFKVNLEDSIFAGELALNGDIRHINGVLPLAIFAKKTGIKNLFIPKTDVNEASLVEGINIFPCENLKQVIEHLNGTREIPVFKQTVKLEEDRSDDELDMSMVKGQDFAKRALEIAAAGNHNTLMSGPPGSGKTLLARTFASILPPLTPEESLEITKIYSVSGLLKEGLITKRPFRSPHHTISNVALVGGGRMPKPGEITLSHRGVLFLDEFPEFPRNVLEALRQPLEDGVITISRAQGTLTFPASITLVASQNPCPCGFLSDPKQECTCTTSQIAHYQKKISGPLLDRIDLHIEVPRVEFEKLTSDILGETSAEIRKRVDLARQIQNKRFKELKIFTNSEMGNKEIKQHCKLEKDSIEMLRLAVSRLNLSARGYNRIIKLSRTIADLENYGNIELKHIAEALQYRNKK